MIDMLGGELTELSNWFKKNVLDLSDADGDVNFALGEDVAGAMEPAGFSDEYEEPDIKVARSDDLRAAMADVSERDQDLSLLTYIIGIDEM